MASSRNRLPNWVPTFLQAFRQEGHVGTAARIANVDRSTPYQLKRRSTLFRSMWLKTEEAIQKDLLEAARTAFEA